MKVIPPLTITDTGTFTNASANRSYFNADGLLCYAAINEPRYSYDPADLSAPPELLDEEAATNLLTRSAEFDNATWAKTSATVTPNAAVAPDGTMTADKLEENATTAQHNISRYPSVTAGSVNTVSVYLKADTRSLARVLIYNGGSNLYGVFVNLITGVVSGVVSGGTFDNAAFTVRSAGVDWWRVSVTASFPGTTSGLTVNLCNAPGIVNYLGSAGSGIYVWGAQFEAGAFATSYIPTTTAAVTRAADVNTAMLVSNVVEVAPPAYSSGTTYSAGQQASVAGAAGLIAVYESRQPSNLANAPSSSPTWWRSLGDTYQEYSGAATYALTDRVIDATAHRVYESLAAGNIGNALSDATKWQEIGPTNKWAMFDLYRDTATVAASPLVVVLQPGTRIDSIAALALSATRISMSMSNAGVEVWSASSSLDERVVENWYDYFFAAFSTQASHAEFDLPPYSAGTLTVVIENSLGDVACGALVVGSQVDIGRIQYGAESDVLNFSTVTRDFAGNTSAMVPRRNVPRTIQQIFADKARVNAIRAIRDALGGAPAVWAGIDQADDAYFEALLILGFYKRFSINLAFPEHAVLSLELEEI